MVAFDPDPSTIRRPRARRDEPTQADRVEILLDPQGEAKQGLFIAVSAAGDVVDGTYDVASFDSSYDFLFDHAARVTPEGWQAEIAVPFSSLRFSPAKESRWLFMLTRFIVRNDTEVVAMLPQNRDSQDPRDGMAYLLLDTSGARAARVLHLVPTWVGSHLRETDGDSETRASGELGLTAEWSPQPQTLVKGTFRPDFSQVEADDTYQKINNRYPVFIAEKRPFFLEGSESYATPIQLFYSRKIVQPEWGLRLSHRQEKLGIFALVAQEQSVPGERFGMTTDRHTAFWGILRGTWALDEAGSFLGATVTAREFAGSWNRVFSLDGVASGEKLNLRWQVAGSHTAGGEGDENGTAARIEARMRWSQFWQTSVTAYRISPDFRADAGFVPRLDREFARVEQRFTYKPQEKLGLLRDAALGAWGWGERTTRHELVSQGAGLFASVTLPRQIFASCNGSRSTEVFLQTRFSGLWDVSCSASWGQYPWFQPSGSVTRGREILYGREPRVGPSESWAASMQSEWGAFSASASRFAYAFAGNTRTQESWQASLAYIFSDRLNAKLFLVDDTLSFRDFGLRVKSRSINALLTYRVNVFSAVYLGANLALDKSAELPPVAWERLQQQQVFAKVSWYF